MTLMSIINNFYIGMCLKLKSNVNHAFVFNLQINESRKSFLP